MHVPDIAAIAALVGDPTRASMLALLMGGRAQTATELALEGAVAPSTASFHLARLTAAGLTARICQGRHRYYRLASPQIAAVIEGLMTIAPPSPATSRAAREEGLRRARICYDHLAGEAAVQLFERLCERGLFASDSEGVVLTEDGEAWCSALGIARERLSPRRRLCRPCLDWTERRSHLAGALGAALLARLLELGWVRRIPGGRAVTLSRRGERFIAEPAP